MFGKKLRWLASVLVAALLIQTLYSAMPSGSTLVTGAYAEEEAKSDYGLISYFDELGLQTDALGSTTWAQGAKFLCRLLGYIEEDVSDIDLTAYSGIVSGLSGEDDSLYLGILAANGYLSYLDRAINPEETISQSDLEQLLAAAFPEVIDTQEKADSQSVFSDSQNLAVIGEIQSLSAMNAGHIALITQGMMTLTGVKASTAAVYGSSEAYLEGTELQRAVIGSADGAPAYLHVDSQTKLSEIVLTGSGDVTIEGNGSFGRIRIMGDMGTVTVRATASVSNETGDNATVIGPDGEECNIAPGEAVDFILENYVVSFVTDGTPVETKLVAPGDMLDYGAISTEKDGEVFTAWYEDAGYTTPFSLLSPIEGETTLYARFVGAADALTVTFETFDGKPLNDLYFAAGESLLTKPITSIYTAKDGFSFSGWCSDEELTEAFSYTEPITESMTLYALFLNDEPVIEEEKNAVAELKGFDWLAGIPVSVPEGASLSDLPNLFHIAEASGGEDDLPVFDFRETETGFAIYGAHYEQEGKTGFRPGETFSIEAGEGASFEGFDTSVKTLTVSVFREDIELIEFRDDISYILWENMASYTAVVETEEDNQANTPGEVLLSGDIGVKPGDVFALYDGNFFDGDRSVSKLDGNISGAEFDPSVFEGYYLFAKALDCTPHQDGTVISFDYADPTEYIAALEVHATDEYDMSEQLTDDVIARMTDDFTRQIMANDELKAQMLVAVMTSPDTQKRLDDIYGEGVYSLAATDFNSVKYKMNIPDISFSQNGKWNTIQIVLSFSVNMVDDMGLTVLSVSPKLTLREEISADYTINGGYLWVDVGIEYHRVHTIRMEVAATTGHGTGTTVIDDAIDTLSQVISPDGMTEPAEYQANINRLMGTIQSISNESLNYVDIYAHELSKKEIKIIIGGVEIGIFSSALEIPIQFGILATIGCQFVITDGCRIGFSYNFLMNSGSSYKQKLENNTSLDVFIIGKAGVRIGLRQTFALLMFDKVKVSIAGGVYVYAELTGIYFYTRDLGTGASTKIGGLYFEAGVEAEIPLDLKVSISLLKYSKSWTIWRERWPLYSTSWSTSMTYPALEKMDEAWMTATANAETKRSYGFATVPTHNYSLFNGTHTTGEILWDAVSTGYPKLTLEIQNLVLRERSDSPEGAEPAEILIGAAAQSTDPRAKILSLGDGSPGKSAGRVYVNEEVAADYMIESLECDVVFVFEDTRSSALVKRMERTFHLSRKFDFSTTTVNVRFVLYDWCAHSWGIEAAAWDNELAYETQIQSRHAIGGLYTPTETAEIDLNAIVGSARSMHPDMSNVTFDWMRRTANGMTGAVQYSTPLVSNTCYLAPGSNSIRYDVRSETDEYTLTWYLYAYRFPGYTGNVNYIVNLKDPAADSEYGFSVKGRNNANPMQFAAVGTEKEAATWSLTAHRSMFNGTNQPLMIAVDEGEPYATGLNINGREPEETVILEVKQGNVILNIELGDGVSGYTVVSPEIKSGDLLKPNTEITLLAEPIEGYRNIELNSDPQGLAYTVDDKLIVFNMPSYDVTVKLMANPVNQIDYMYNYGDLGAYKTAYWAANENIAEPDAPRVNGLTFRGWHDNPGCAGEAYAFGGLLDGNLTLYADWTCDVTVDLGGAAGQAAYYGKDGKPVLVFEGDYSEYARFTYSTLRVGETPHEIILPNREGYNFKGWYLTADDSGDAVDLTKFTLTGGITLYARWAKIVEVKYDLNYGVEPLYYQAYEESGWPMLDTPADPVRGYYQFSGWYTSAGCAEDTRFDPAANSAEDEDMILYAGWIADKFGIAYDLAGGEKTGKNPAVYTVESGAIKLSNPTRVGYTFAGWTGTDLTAPAVDVTIPAGSTGERAYTANWKVIVYTISYNLVRGTLSKANPATYTIESGDIVLANPSKEKYEFMGWTGTGLNKAELTVTIPKGSTGNRSYTATWKTDDPDSRIADYAIDAIKDTYTYGIDGYVDGAGKNGSLYPDARADIDNDVNASPYKDGIALKLTKTSNQPIESAIDYTHIYNVEITYSSDSGVTLTRNKQVTVVVLKRVATVAAPPVAGNLLYKQSLENSALNGGTMEYGGNPVGGAFAWVDKGIVPLAQDNGNAMYRVIFTPTAGFTALYAAVEFDIPVKTQVGVRVEITAQDREYVAGITTTQGSYTLYDADTDAELYVGEGLAGGEYNFAQAGAGDTPIEVTFTNYALDVNYFDPLGDYVIYGADPTTAAYINWITPVLDAGVVNTVTYEDTLSGAYLPNATAKHNGNNVLGSWTLTLAGNGGTTVNVVGMTEMTAAFTPDDLLGYKTGTVSFMVTIQKKAITEPVDGFADKTYTGINQVYSGTVSAYYTITKNVGGINVGSYPVEFTLSNPACTYWYLDNTKAIATYERNFNVVKASLAVTGTPTVKSLGYGQELTNGDIIVMSTYNTQMDWKLPANEMIIGGIDVKFNSVTVDGIWEWDLSSLTAQSLTQPLDASGSGYTVRANYNITNSPDAMNFNSISREFTVVVEKSKPEAYGGFSLRASDMYQTPSLYFPITYSIIEYIILGSGGVANPVTGVTIDGKWEWEKINGEYPKPTIGTNDYMAYFHPNNTANYNDSNSESVSVTAVNKKRLEARFRTTDRDTGVIDETSIQYIKVDGEVLYNTGTPPQGEYAVICEIGVGSVIEVLFYVKIDVRAYSGLEISTANFVGNAPSISHEDVPSQMHKWTITIGEGMWLGEGFTVEFVWRPETPIPFGFDVPQTPGDGTEINP